MNEICELQFDAQDNDKDYSTWCTDFDAILPFARTLVNPWCIVRQDGVVIAMSYDGFTSIEQSAANGREP